MNPLLRSCSHCGTRVLSSTCLLAVIAIALISPPALAESITGWGDTGWSHDSKRECCEDAVWLAQDAAIANCEAAGGRAKIRSGTARGLCDWDGRGGGRDRVYRCTAKADVSCR